MNNFDLIGKRFVYFKNIWEVQELFYTDNCFAENLSTHIVEKFDCNYIKKWIEHYENDKIKLGIDDSDLNINNNIIKIN